jgi:hypothetical protein
MNNEPSDESGILALAKELERIRSTAKDFVVPTKRMHALRSPDGDLTVSFDGFVTSYNLTKHGHNQLAEKVGIPEKYYWKMLNEGMTTLTAENVNAWLHKQEDIRLIRIADGKIRAILSNRYRVLDNYDLAMLVLARAKEHRAIIQQCSLTETHMYVKLVVPNYVEAVKSGDDVVPGLVVSNSEVGVGAFRVEPFLFRLICKNGLIGETNLYKVHLGSRLEIGEDLVYKDDTRKAQDDALWMQVRDVIDSTFDPTVLRALVAKLRDTQNVKVEKVREALDVTAKNLSLSKEMSDELLSYFTYEGPTIYGLINSVTRMAQNFTDYEDKIRCERYAGEILELNAVPPAK